MSLPAHAPTAAAAGPSGAPVRVASVAAFGTAEGLASVLGPLEAVERRPLSTPGKSGAVLESLRVRLETGQERRLVLKRSRLEEDVVRRRSGGVDREGRLLAEPALAGVWEAFYGPHLAYAAEGDETALLMDDLTAYLVPAGEAPISEAQEDTILAALAALHARFWGAEALTLPWLLDPAEALALMSAASAEQELARGVAGPTPPSELFVWMREGWAALSRRVPHAVGTLLREPREPFVRACAALPRTLLHGDARLVNFALLPRGRAAAFDWQLAAAGPCTLDLGFYLIGNAHRRARPAAACASRYRGHLQAGLGMPLPDQLWERLVDVGILYGAATLLWDRTLDLEEGLPGAADEWQWWVAELERRWVRGT